MRFFLDHNVDGLIADVLRTRGHTVVLLTDELPSNAEDHLVATVAMRLDCILVSHDRDMKRIERKISDGWRVRYPHLCRIMLCCPEIESACRFEIFLPIIDIEYREAALADVPMMFEIGARRVRLHR